MLFIRLLPTCYPRLGGLWPHLGELELGGAHEAEGQEAAITSSRKHTDSAAPVPR